MKKKKERCEIIKRGYNNKIIKQKILIMFVFQPLYINNIILLDSFDFAHTIIREDTLTPVPRCTLKIQDNTGDKKV